MLKFAVRKTSSSIFHDAVARKDIVRLAFLMESNRRQFNVDLLDEDGLTALQRACFTGNLKLVQLLVSYGANLDIQDKEGWSVLHAAAVAGNLSILRYLVAVGADVSVRNDLGELPIDVATDVHCVIVLAEGMKRAGLRKLTDKFFAKRPQLKTLIKDRYIGMISSGTCDNKNSNNDQGVKLIEIGGPPDKGSLFDDGTVLIPRRAVCKKCQGRKRYSTASTCSSGSSTSSSSDSAYISSMSLSESYSDSQAVITLDRDIEWYSAFAPSTPHQTSTPSSTPSKSRLRQEYFYTKPRGVSSPPDLSSKVNALSSLIQGLDNVNDLNDSGISLLHEMAGRGDSESVQFLLEHGAEVNRQSLNGSSPLHEAVQSGNIDCTLLLLRSGADLYAETDGGFLPIDIARENTIRDILRRAMSIR
ncbi:protein phosphatase 1 regulatory subunit 16A [Nematostella vectensis]|uniref:protein phosphatase 1 regulatory subunit 16A n=1 Tax=Nematostella vectensis TaxID=45351 RepID=UPI00138FD221|nr:protein phosphatase 1 regulatory subunit 16A [Nematostella vectensis]